jgi:Transglutaminase-like superfamily
VIGWLARKVRAAFDVAVAISAVTRARKAVAHRPIGDLVDARTLPEAEPTSAAAPIALTHREWRLSERWGAAVDRALRWVPGDAACLVRSSALRELVSARGLPSAEVRIGVRRGAAGFEAHAWVEVNGTPLAEPAVLRGAFAPLDGVTIR